MSRIMGNLLSELPRAFIGKRFESMDVEGDVIMRFHVDEVAFKSNGRFELRSDRGDSQELDLGQALFLADFCQYEKVERFMLREEKE